MTDSQQDNTSSDGHNIWLLIAIVGLGLCLALINFTGYEGEADDAQYITEAIELSRGDLPPYYDFSRARLGLILPLAGLFAVFGPSYATITILPLFWFVVGIVLAYVSGRVVYHDSRIGLLAATLMAVFPLHVIKATQYWPDIGVAMLAWIAFLCFYRGEQTGSKYYFAAAGLAAGLAYMYRFTGLFVLLPFVIYVVYRRRWTWNYSLTLLVLAVVVLCEMATFAGMFGDPLFRLHSLMGGSGRAPTGHEAIRPGGYLLSPLLSLSTNQEYGLIYFLVAWSILGLIWKRDQLSAPVLLFFLAVGFYTLWGTVHPFVYSPLRPWPRYFAIVSIPAVLLLSRWLCTYCGIGWRRAIVVVLFVTSIACSHVDNCKTRYSIGDALYAFRQEHPEETLYLPSLAYFDLYVANGFIPPENVVLLGTTGNGNALRVDPGLSAVEANDVPIQSYVARKLKSSSDGVPNNWRAIAECRRARRWFVSPLSQMGRAGESLSQRLSPAEGFIIYQVDPVE